jgi:hypothetical protein
MRDAELRAWSDDAALALTILVRVGLGDTQLEVIGYAAYGFLSSRPISAQVTAPLLLPWLVIGTLWKRIVIPAEGVAALEAMKGDLRQVPVELGTP